ncbi:MAG: hypothetical protein JXQ90_05385 [Cyclobacteriaceae bacterium]
MSHYIGSPLQFVDLKNGKIKWAKLYEFLNANGIYGYLDQTGFHFVKIDKCIMQEIDPRYIRHFIAEAFRLCSTPLDDAMENLLQTIHQLTGLALLDSIAVTEDEILSDTLEFSFLFFQNGIVKISKETEEFFKFPERGFLVWQDQIIKRDFNPEQEGKCQFEIFIKNCMNNDSERIKCMMSAIGYLLHRHKTPSEAVAIIFCDEEDSDNPEGGTGKSLTVNGIKQLRTLVKEDGKTFKFNNFAFQQVTSSTDIILFEDLDRKFDFEKLFPVITDGITVEKKYKDRKFMDFSSKPKIMITTNYMINGIGNSFERRKIEYEFSNYYGKTRTPEQEFNCLFFAGWDDSEWSRFYGFMIECIKHYLKNGLLRPSPINLEIRKLKNTTNPEFVEFMDDFIVSKRSQTQCDRKILYLEFIGLHTEFEKWLNPRQFNRWLEIYGQAKGYQTKIKKSGDFRFITFIKKGDSPNDDLSTGDFPDFDPPLDSPPSDPLSSSEPPPVC